MQVLDEEPQLREVVTRGHHRSPREDHCHLYQALTQIIHVLDAEFARQRGYHCRQILLVALTDCRYGPGELRVAPPEPREVTLQGEEIQILNNGIRSGAEVLAHSLLGGSSTGVRLRQRREESADSPLDNRRQERESDRVAIGWSGGYCGVCRNCRRGDFVYCEVGMVTGATFPGGCADYLVAPATALARIPDGLSAVDAAPLACAGLTVFNSLRRTGAGPGDLVAILGIGGLGHLGVQFAVKMGFRTVAIARGPEKDGLARQLGAHHYIDSVASDVAAELQKLGGARVIAATATDADAMTAAVGGLGLHGELLTLAVVDDPVQVSPTQLISISGTVHGHTSGASCDLEDTLNFAALQGIKPMVEVLPLEKVADGYQRMVTNQARFRVVLTTAH